jgi:hypothetical protein
MFDIAKSQLCTGAATVSPMPIHAGFAMFAAFMGGAVAPRRGSQNKFPILPAVVESDWQGVGSARGNRLQSHEEPGCPRLYFSQ